MRLFAGISLSTAAIERLSSVRLRCAANNDGLRWSAPEQWHITLRFFGEVEEGEAERLCAALTRLPTVPPRLHIERFGVFAAKGIFFAEVDATPELQDLYGQVQGIAIECGPTPEARPLHPHITLARSKNRTGLASVRRLSHPVLPAFGQAVSWLAQEVWVYESVLQRDGASYRTLARIPLGLDSLNA